MCYENLHNVLPRKRDSTVDARCYELSYNEKDSLKQIGEYMKTGYADMEIFKEHEEYLLHMIEKLGGVIECERSVGAPVESIEFELENIKRMFNELTKKKI